MPTEQAPQDRGSRVLIRCDASVHVDELGATIELDDVSLAVHGLPAAAVGAILDGLDRHASTDLIAGAAGCSVRAVHELARTLVAAGAAVEVPDEPTDELVPAHELTTLCDRVFPAWKERLFSRPLWPALADGSAPRPLALGWLIESYYFIEGVTVRLPSAIAACRNPALRAHFARHYAEEFDHHHFFAKALRTFGVDAEHLARRRPLPGTLAVLHHMRDAARQDYLAYAACSAFLESTGGDRTRAHAFLAQVNAHYGHDGGSIRPLIDHLQLDGDYGHAGFLDALCTRLAPVTRTRVDLALQAARTLVDSLELWSDDIVEHYASGAALDAGVRGYRMQARRAHTATTGGAA